MTGGLFCVASLKSKYATQFSSVPARLPETMITRSCRSGFLLAESLWWMLSIWNQTDWSSGFAAGLIEPSQIPLWYAVWSSSSVPPCLRVIVLLLHQSGRGAGIHGAPGQIEAVRTF